MTVGEKIKEARLAAGLTQAQLAEKMKKTPQFISNYEADRRRAKLGTLKQFADALNIDASQLFLADTLQYAYVDHPEILEYEKKYGTPFDVEPVEKELLEAFHKLNNNGKAVAAARVEELTKISEYRK